MDKIQKEYRIALIKQWVAEGMSKKEAVLLFREMYEFGEDA